jgi:hypothetical protein
MRQKPIGENAGDNKTQNGADNHPFDTCGSAYLEFHFFLASAQIVLRLAITRKPYRTGGLTHKAATTDMRRCRRLVSAPAGWGGAAHLHTRIEAGLSAICFKRANPDSAHNTGALLPGLQKHKLPFYRWSSFLFSFFLKLRGAISLGLD